MAESSASKSIEEVSRSDLSAPARLAVRKELQRLEALIDPKEVVVSLARGAYKGRFGLVAVTGKRVIFVDRAKIHSLTASFSLRRVQKIETGTTPLGYGRIELYLESEGPVPERLRFKIVPKAKTDDLARAISTHSGVGRITDVGLVPDESVELDSSGMTRGEAPNQTVESGSVAHSEESEEVVPREWS